MYNNASGTIRNYSSWINGFDNPQDSNPFHDTPVYDSFFFSSFTGRTLVYSAGTILNHGYLRNGSNYANYVEW